MLLTIGRQYPKELRWVGHLGSTSRYIACQLVVVRVLCAVSDYGESQNDRNVQRLVFLIGIEELDGFAKYFLFLPVLLLARFTTAFNCLASLALPKHCVGTLNCPAIIALMALLDVIFSYSVSVGKSWLQFPRPFTGVPVAICCQVPITSTSKAASCDLFFALCSFYNHHAGLSVGFLANDCIRLFSPLLSLCFEGILGRI